LSLYKLAGILTPNLSLTALLIFSYFFQEYVKCLKDQDSNHHKCRELSKNYLQCRMDNELMAKENLEEVCVILQKTFSLII